MSEPVSIARFADDRLDGIPRWVVWHMIRHLGLNVSRQEKLDDQQQVAIEAEWHRMLAEHANIQAHLREIALEHARREVRAVIPAVWLAHRTSVETVEAERRAKREAKAMECERAAHPTPAPKWPQRHCMSWTALLELIQQGDELWWYDSVGDSWQKMCGRAGYAIVRNGEVIGSLLIEMN
jgi:hypothetical protein